MKKAVALAVCLTILTSVCFPLYLCALSGTKMESVIDFSVLPVSEKSFYYKKCQIETNTDLFTSGIMVDPADSIGVGEDKTNFRGFYTRDTDGDKKTDTLCAVGHNTGGMRFTFGVDSDAAWSEAGGIVMHIDNSANAWNGVQTLNLTLNLTDGTSVGLKPVGDAAGETVYFISDSKTVVAADLNATRAFIPGSASGWLILPRSAFSGVTQFPAVSSVKFDFSSKALVYTAISSIGIVKDADGFVREKAGGTPFAIDSTAVSGGSAVIQVGGLTTNRALAGAEVKVLPTPENGYDLMGVLVTDAKGEPVATKGSSFIMPDEAVTVEPVFESQNTVSIPSRYYTALSDFSGLPVGDYRGLDWDCMVDTGSAIYQKGVIINKEPVGIGDDKTNFHGFWAVDANGDGETDYLKLHPYNDNGYRFTWGFNSGNTQVENPKYLLMRIEITEIVGSSWQSGVTQGIGITLNDRQGNSHVMAAKADAPKVRFLSARDFSVTEYEVTGGSVGLPVGETGWLAVPMCCFEGLTGNEIFTSASFSMTSTWSAYPYFRKIGLVYDDAAFSFLNGSAPRYRLNVTEAQNGTVSVGSVSSFEERVVGINTQPDSGYLLKSLKVTGVKSGKQIPVSARSFVMPAEDVVISVEFEESPYNKAQKLSEIYTVTQDFSAKENIEIVDWVNGPVLDEMIEKGYLVKDLNRGFKDANVTNCYNGNGIYIYNDKDWGNYLRLWAHDNLGMHISIKSNPIRDTTAYDGLVIHLHNVINTANGPGLRPQIYLKDQNGEPDLEHPILPKSAENLYGTTVYLVDDETGEVTEKKLGYSDEQGAAMTNDEKYYSAFFVPDGYEGYVVIPFSYFSKEFSAQDVAAVRLNYDLSYWELYSNIYDLGFVKSIENFVRIASLGDYSEIFLDDQIDAVDASVFARYVNTERKITLTVVKNYIMNYSWIFRGENIKKAIAFNPAVNFAAGTQENLGKFYNNPEEAVLVQIRQSALPGKAQLSFDVSWDFYDGTFVSLYRYDIATGKMTDLGQNIAVSSGFVTFDFVEGGTYLIAMPAFVNNLKQAEKSTKPRQDVQTVTETVSVEESAGHYETTPGKKVYQTVTKISYGAFEPWFIVLLVAAGIAVLGGSTAMILIILKKRREKADEK